MKKLFLIALLSITMSASMAQTNAGGMLGYGSDIERWGLGLNAEFFLNEKMSLAPKLLFYFPETNHNVKTSAWEINGDFHYYFYAETN